MGRGGRVAVVTGGAGFIGSHLVDGLLEKGFGVRVLDNLSSGNLRNLSNASLSKRFLFVRGNITDTGRLRRIVRGADVVFHLAAVVDVQKSFQDPIAVDHVNVDGTLSVLDACRRCDVSKVVYASSAAVYAERLAPIRESDHLEPISPYGVSKLAGEIYVQQFQRTYGVGTTTLRFFNVYGPRHGRNGYSGVITAFANRLTRGQRPIVNSDGKQTRDFVHVSDIVRANLLAATHRATAGVFNVGTGRAVSVLELAELMSRIIVGSDIAPVFQGRRKGDIAHSCANIRKIRSVLGFKPKVSLRTGLRNMLYHEEDSSVTKRCGTER